MTFWEVIKLQFGEQICALRSSSSEQTPETVRYKRVSVERGSTVRTSYFGAEPESSCFFLRFESGNVLKVVWYSTKFVYKLSCFSVEKLNILSKSRYNVQRRFDFSFIGSCPKYLVSQLVITPIRSSQWSNIHRQEDCQQLLASKLCFSVYHAIGKPHCLMVKNVTKYVSYCPVRLQFYISFTLCVFYPHENN